ncbi:acetoacetate--CoA ligase [Nocardia aurea]|uniref:acetoacetate--CoA ligase n=1 Tax=Nocardia aurea TaxID=2144174 RepID=UPI001E4954E5|nr:acetoacetate--CoA ligase [Nocardia aurea]
MPEELSDRPLWTPDPSTAEGSNIAAFQVWLADRRDLDFDDYRAMHAWSVREPDRFWGLLCEYFGIIRSGSDHPVRRGDRMPEVEWFPDLHLNYVEQVLRHADTDSVAIIDESEPGGLDTRKVTWRELRRQVAAVAAFLRSRGVAPGDRVVGYLPNIAEAVIAFLATASVGAIWSSCGQDYAASAAADRLGQLEPVVLIAADGYRYAGKQADRRSSIAELREAMPSVRTTIVVARLGLEIVDLTGIETWAEVSAGEHELEPTQVPFEHPLWVLFSSGTSGRPKGIVHGHGGVLIEHLKQMTFHLDLRPGDTYFWYTSPSWMMWNFQVAGLLVGATIVAYDGSPTAPTPEQLWSIAARHNVAVLGTSPAYLQACEKSGSRPTLGRDLRALRTLGATGAVLPPASYEWAARELGGRVALASTTGGTDVVSAFAGFVPTVPVRIGELSVPCLGVALEAWDNEGRPVIDEVGELVVTAPLPSMPLCFWNDAEGARYRAAYFDSWPGVWRHGDWITVTERGSVIVHGRSDATLNRNGVRMGSSDVYQAVEKLAEVKESLLLGVEYPDGKYWMPLFVVLADGVELDDDLRGRLRTAIVEGASPRHVPDEVIAVRGIPHTRTGKKLEIPLKRLMQGADLGDVADARSIDDPALLELFAAIAAEQQIRRGSREEVSR